MKVHPSPDIDRVQKRSHSKTVRIPPKKAKHNNLLKTKRILNILHTDIQTKWWPIF